VNRSKESPLGEGGNQKLLGGEKKRSLEEDKPWEASVEAPPFSFSNGRKSKPLSQGQPAGIQKEKPHRIQLGRGRDCRQTGGALGSSKETESEARNEALQHPEFGEGRGVHWGLDLSPKQKRRKIYMKKGNPTKDNHAPQVEGQVFARLNERGGKPYIIKGVLPKAECDDEGGWRSMPSVKGGQNVVLIVKRKKGKILRERYRRIKRKAKTKDF